MDPRSVVTMAGGTPRRVDKPSGKSVVMVAKRWHVLEVMALTFGWQTFVELGVFKGWTIFHLMKHCPGLRLIGVDAYKQPEGEGAEVYPVNMDRLYRRMSEKAGGRITLIRSDTCGSAALNHVRDGEADAVFVDADHREQHVRADVTAWLPKVKPGGWMLGHDWHHPGVISGVMLALPNGPKPLLLPDNVWAVRC